MAELIKNQTSFSSQSWITLFKIIEGTDISDFLYSAEQLFNLAQTIPSFIEEKLIHY